MRPAYTENNKYPGKPGTGISCVLPIIALLTLLLLMTGCSTSYLNSEADSAEGTIFDENSDLSNVKNAGVLKIGVVEGTALMYQEEGSEKWTGFSAEMAELYAKSLGVEAEFIPVEPDQARELLESRKIDCLWGRMVWTEDQINNLSMSKPYVEDKLAIIVHFKHKDRERCTDPDKLTKMREFVVVEGSPGEEKAKELGANYSTEKDIVHCLLRVAAGTASCALLDVLDSTSMVGKGTQFHQLVYTVTFDLNQFSAGFRKDSDLAPEADAFLQSVYEDGTTLNIANKYRIPKMILPIEQK